MNVVDMRHLPMASREVRPPFRPRTPEVTDDVSDDLVAEALAFASRITAQVRKPVDATPLGVPRVA